MNLYAVVGRLTRDVETVTTKSGKTVAKFGVAVDSRKETVFLNCEAWNGTGEFVAKYFKKGKPISLVGELAQESWESDDGKKTRLVFCVDRVNFVVGVPKKDEEAAPEPASPKPKSTKKARVPEDVNYNTGPEDDIPF